MLHKASVAGLAMDPASNTPIILLKTEEEGQVVPIWIGLLEATSIASALKNITYDRPMTHDLFKNFIVNQGVDVVKIDICDLKDNTYYALVHFISKDGGFTMDARPSDAIAMALRFDAPIFVEDRVITKSTAEDEKAEAADTSEEGKKWAEYLEKLSPDEFGKFKV